MNRPKGYALPKSAFLHEPLRASSQLQATAFGPSVRTTLPLAGPPSLDPVDESALPDQNDPLIIDQGVTARVAGVFAAL